MMRSVRFLAALVLFAAFLNGEARAAADKFYVPPSHFNAALQVMKMGYANVMGLFGNATAGLSYDAETKKLSAIKLAVDTGSLTTANSANGRDLAQLLGTLQHREMTFVAPGSFEVKDGKAEIKGKLTLHGVSKEAAFQATINQVKTDEDGKALGLSLAGEVKRADFGMDDESSDAAQGFGETIKLTFEMQAIAP